MTNCLIVFPNRAMTAAMSGGSFTAGSPLANLKTRFISQLARTTDTLPSSSTWDTDQGGDYPVRVFALANTNAQVFATGRLLGSNDPAFASTLYDSGVVDEWPVMFTDDTTEWEDEGPWWTGRPSAAERAGLRHTFIHVLPKTVNAQHWRFLHDDQTNPDGYCQFGLEFLAPGWLLGRNFARGNRLQWVDPALVGRSRGGAIWTDPRPKYRVWSCQIPLLGIDEAYQKGLEMMRRQGVTEPVLVVPDPDDATNMIYRAFVGRLSALGGLTDTFHKRGALDVQIEELVA